MQKTEHHKLLCNLLHETYLVKNEAYGDSFSASIQKHGYIAALIRMEDKMNRVDSLIHGAENNVNDESLADTLMDLANYSLLLILELAHDNSRKEAIAHDSH